MTQPVHKLTVTEKIGYGFGDLASNLFWQMFSIFIAKYYTDVFLLGAATMGTMLLVTRIGDAIIDPVVGAIADRTNTRWGHFRPYLLWMAVPMALTAVATFTVPDFGGTGRVVYAYVTLSLMMLAYSAINIPYSALLGVLTPDSKDRTSASSYRFVMAFLPVFLIVNTALPMANYFGGSETSARGWQVAMALYAIAATLLYFLTFAMTKERVKPEVGQKTSLREDVADLFKNKPWIMLCTVGIAALTYANIRGTVAIYYFENVVPEGKGWFGAVMTTGAVAFIVGVMATSPLAKRFGKRNFYIDGVVLLRARRQPALGLGHEHVDQLGRGAHRALGLGDVCRHGRLLGMEVRAARHRLGFFGSFVRAKTGLGHWRRGHGLAAGLLWLPAQCGAKRGDHQRHHADDERDSLCGGSARRRRSVVLRTRRNHGGAHGA